MKNCYKIDSWLFIEDKCFEFNIFAITPLGDLKVYTVDVSLDGNYAGTFEWCKEVIVHSSSRLWEDKAEIVKQFKEYLKNVK